MDDVRELIRRTSMLEQENEDLKKKIEELEEDCDVKDAEIRRLHQVIREMREERA